MTPPLGRIDAYAVVRYDHYLGEDVAPEAKITVKEILPSREEAEREVQRLNALERSRDRVYFWQYTRYFPEGRRSPSEP
jgi:hypothetical protein